jgi:23S rRNA (uridine2552-2'-O)-methyltransferase
LRTGTRVVHLGCAPGGLAQVAVGRVNAFGQRADKRQGRVMAVDLQGVEPIPGAEIHKLDIMADGADAQVKEWLDGPADVIMSDMAAASSCHKQTVHLHIIVLARRRPGSPSTC